MNTLSRAHAGVINVRSKRVLLLAATLLLSACGSTSNLRSSDTDRKVIADFDRVEVLDFAATAHSSAKSAATRAEHATAVAGAQVEFADRIAKKIRESGAFKQVSREPLDGPRLRVTGIITVYEEGNVAARSLVGFIGRALFEAQVTFTDADSGRVLGTVEVDRGSWPLPVASYTNLVQNVTLFMNGAADKIADELAIARGVKTRPVPERRRR